MFAADRDFLSFSFYFYLADVLVFQELFREIDYDSPGVIYRGENKVRSFNFGRGISYECQLRWLFVRRRRIGWRTSRVTTPAPCAIFRTRWSSSAVFRWARLSPWLGNRPNPAWLRCRPESGNRVGRDFRTFLLVWCDGGCIPECRWCRSCGERTKVWGNGNGVIAARPSVGSRWLRPSSRVAGTADPPPTPTLICWFNYVRMW